jgi:FtsZ-binding cell division protein ZapB
MNQIQQNETSYKSELNSLKETNAKMNIEIDGLKAQIGNLKSDNEKLAEENAIFKKGFFLHLCFVRSCIAFVDYGHVRVVRGQRLSVKTTSFPLAKIFVRVVDLLFASAFKFNQFLKKFL